MDEQTLEQFLAQEREYGLDYKKLEREFRFRPDGQEDPDNQNNIVTNEFTSAENGSNDNLDAIYLPPGYITPSYEHHISPEDELHLRILGAQIISEAGYALKLPYYTIITAQTMFHRFYYRRYRFYLAETISV